MEKQRHKTVAPEAFIKAWQGAKDIDGVLKTTGMNIHSAQYRARIYRKKGIKLQAFAPRRGAPKLDIAALNKLAQDCHTVVGRSTGSVTQKQMRKAEAAVKKIANKKARKPAKKPAKKSAKKAKK
jgi:hypothetical protein